MASFESKNVLTIKTVQIAPFRTLMTALKDILLETNITFKKDGIRIINMDKSHTMLAHLFLGAENFEHYECKKEKIVIGVNMFHLFKLINSIDNDDTLTIYIEEDDYYDEKSDDEYIPNDIVPLQSDISFLSNIMTNTSLINSKTKCQLKSVGSQLLFKNE